MLEQGAQGYHHLFDDALIREAFLHGEAVQSGLDEGTAARASSLIDALREAAQIDAQRAVIASAPPRVQQVMVHLYFHYLERFMHRAGVVYH